MEFKQGKNLLEISQSGYIETILNKFGMKEQKPSATPTNPGIKLKKLGQFQAEKEENIYPF